MDQRRIELLTSPVRVVKRGFHDKLATSENVPLPAPLLKNADTQIHRFTRQNASDADLMLTRRRSHTRTDATRRPIRKPAVLTVGVFALSVAEAAHLSEHHDDDSQAPRPWFG